MEDLVLKITKDLGNGFINSKNLLSRCRLVQDETRKSIAYQDPIYLPFYYYLGKHIQSQHLMVIGFRMGLATVCFAQGSKTLKSILAFQPKVKEYYSTKIGFNNVRDVFKGKLDAFYGDISDVDFGHEKLDIVIVDDVQPYVEHLKYLETVWEHMAEEGLIVVDYIGVNKEIARSFDDFCKIKNRKPIFFEKTRYTVGIIKR